MGIFIVVFIAIFLALFFISRTKIPRVQKVLWFIIVLISIISVITYLFIRGFESGRDPHPMPSEELNAPKK